MGSFGNSERASTSGVMDTIQKGCGEASSSTFVGRGHSTLWVVKGTYAAQEERGFVYMGPGAERPHC